MPQGVVEDGAQIDAGFLQPSLVGSQRSTSARAPKPPPKEPTTPPKPPPKTSTTRPRPIRWIPPVEANLSDYFSGGVAPRASDLDKYAAAQGWTKTQTPDGPPKYVDENGVTRMTLKAGSGRAPGSGHAHVELRNDQGTRIDPHGEPVTRKSPGNHTPIDWDW
ncbi:hypothetical protein V1457_25895 [Saccharopolyspora sp. SCSIO 74807]